MSKTRKKKKSASLNPFNIIKFLGEDPNYKEEKKITDEDNEQAMTETTYTSLKFASWVQTFTKRIIVVTFGIFVIMDLITLVVAIINCLRLSDTSSINNLITETNTTFRDVIGGYLIKSACENVSIGIEKAIVRFIDKRDQEATNAEIETELQNQDQAEPADAGESTDTTTN